RMNRVMDYVRDNPAGDHSVETLAGIAYFSPFHFHRAFKAVTGETVAAFVRRARLERAAHLMKAAPKRKLTSIALDLGYPSLSELSRAFRREYGIAPSAWDRKTRLDAATVREPMICELEPGFSASPATPKNAESSSQEAAPAGIEARVVEHEACRLAFVRMRNFFDPDTLPNGFARLTGWLESQGVDWRQEKLIGMSWDHYVVTPLDQVRYDFGFTVPEDLAGGDEVGIRELPAVQSVDVHCNGPLHLIAQAWDYLYDEWLPASRFEPDDLPAMKRYRRRPDESGWATWDVDCSIAIRPLSP
ncbi:MAG: AraC family transcriptional regulator, partial [Acidobacteriota bacterium]